MSSPSTPVRRFRILHWFLIVGAAAMVVVTLKIVGIFFLTKEAHDLQTAISDAGDWRTDTQIQFSVGPGILSIGRLATLWIDDIPGEAREALRAVQCASVGIYQLDQGAGYHNQPEMLASADRKLAARGWERIVTVADGGDLVLIYTPTGWDEADEAIEVCIAVCDGNELVVVSAKAKLAPLLKVAQQHLPDWKTI